MTGADFLSIHAHGLVRVAGACLAGTSGDVAANVAGIVELARAASDRHVDMLVFPELSVSSYAIDDLHLQDALLDRVERGIAEIAAASAGLSPLLLVGAPVRRCGRVYNCAIAIARGRLLGVVPKIYLPNYREYYEKRWFASGAGLTGMTMRLAGQDVAFGTDLLFAASDLPDFIVHAETCEDFWAPLPPSTFGTMAGATIVANLSASNITIGKARERAMLCASQSARTISAYVFSAAGPGESTNDHAWDGQAMVHEHGSLLAESARFSWQPELVVADVDVQRLRLERMRTGTFNDCAAVAGHPETRFRTVAFEHRPATGDIGLVRPVRRFPFVPVDPLRLDQDCYEAFNIQVEGLAKRMRATGSQHLVIGVSGGLDSTHALIVAAKACDRLGLPRTAILGFTMPGFATGEASKGYAWALMEALGITGEEIDIRPAAQQMLAAIGHPFARGEPVYDLTFENVQAGLRTDTLFRLAGQRGGFVVGTGDLSELALGWCTYGVGDQMSHYGVNAGVPKTLIQHLIRWAVRSDQFDAATDAVLTDIVGAEISPELVPPGADGKVQSTETTVGPYALHDFFAHHVVRYGLPPSKIAFLAWHAWRDADAGEWPEGVPSDARRAYDLPTVAHWLRAFLRRFFATSQYKRTAMPNGPKVSAAGSLSPRGDWRAPSDGTAAPWIEELDAALGSVAAAQQ